MQEPHMAVTEAVPARGPRLVSQVNVDEISQVLVGFQLHASTDQVAEAKSLIHHDSLVEPFPKAEIRVHAILCLDRHYDPGLRVGEHSFDHRLEPERTNGGGIIFQDTDEIGVTTFEQPIPVLGIRAWRELQ